MQDEIFSPGIIKHPEILKKISDARNSLKFFKKRIKTRTIIYYIQIICTKYTEFEKPPQYYHDYRNSTFPFYTVSDNGSLLKNRGFYKNPWNGINYFVDLSCWLSFNALWPSNGYIGSSYYTKPYVAVIKQKNLGLIDKFNPYKNFNIFLRDSKCWFNCTMCRVGLRKSENSLFCQGCRDEPIISTKTNGLVLIVQHSEKQIVFCPIGYNISNYIDKLKSWEFIMVPFIIV